VNEQGSLGLFEYEVIGHEINIFRGLIIPPNPTKEVPT